jgi:predicted DNA-binding antitoxin AbrB/MazE fold protein
MRTIIEGVYENGQIFLEHKPNLNVKTKVTVIFEETDEQELTAKKRPFGISKGSIELSQDFDDPLEDMKDYM